MSLKKDIVWRVGVVYICVLFFAILILGKIMWLQLVEGSKWEEMAENRIVRDMIIEPNRGDIYGANNRLLSTSVPYYEIRMDLRARGLTDEIFFGNIDSLALRLHKLFRDKSASAYRSELLQARRENRRFHLIKRGVSFNMMKEMENFPVFRLGRNRGGFIAIQDDRRILPHGNLASRTIGYITKSESGNVVGIEGAYDEQLRGVVGLQLMRRISGNVWMPLNDRNEVEPRDGYDIVTSIDVEIQDVATSALLRQLRRHGAHHGTAVLMEVGTGDIKAIANLQMNSNGGYSESYNFAIGESTEPGSTFKLMSLMAAMEDGYINPSDSVDTGDGNIMFFNQRISDAQEGGLGKITVQEAFEVSSNVAVSKIVHDNYNGKEKNFINRLYKMNLNEKLGVEIRGEGAPDIKYPGDPFWSGVSLPMMSIGYEVRMTPLQILTFYNAIANNGRMVRPRFVTAIKSHGDVIERFPTEVINPSVVSKSTIEGVRLMLEGVVEKGTASNLRNTRYKIAGKTGTAQIANEKYGYRHQEMVSHQASFVGYFPADNPRYSCIVVVNSPSSNIYYGNLVAGPVFREIADKVYATSLDMHEPLHRADGLIEESPFTKSGSFTQLATVLNSLDIDYRTIAYGDNDNDNGESSGWVSTMSVENYVEMRERTLIPGLVPNVVDMSLKDAIYLLENAGLKVEVSGRGKVLSQSVMPGRKVNEGEIIVLQMSLND